MDLDNHPATTDEIRALCLDLGVLGRADFKLLLKWRLAIRKSAGIDKGKRKAPLRGKGDAADDSDASDEEESDKEEGDKTEEDKLMEEMEELQQSMDARARRDKKKKAKAGRRRHASSRSTCTPQLNPACFLSHRVLRGLHVRLKAICVTRTSFQPRLRDECASVYLPLREVESEGADAHSAWTAGKGC